MREDGETTDDDCQRFGGCTWYPCCGGTRKPCTLTRVTADYVDGTISRGLKLTVRLLSIDDYETLVAKM